MLLECHNDKKSVPVQVLYILKDIRSQQDLMLADHREIVERLAKLATKVDNATADSNILRMELFMAHGRFWSHVLAQAGDENYEPWKEISREEALGRLHERICGMRADKIYEMFKEGKTLWSVPYLYNWKISLNYERLVEQAPEAAMVLAECRIVDKWNSGADGCNDDAKLHVVKGYGRLGFRSAKALHGKGFPGFDDVRGKTEEEFLIAVVEPFIASKIERLLQGFEQGLTRIELDHVVDSFIRSDILVSDRCTSLVKNYPKQMKRLCALRKLVEISRWETNREPLRTVRFYASAGGTSCARAPRTRRRRPPRRRRARPSRSAGPRAPRRTRRPRRRRSRERGSTRTRSRRARISWSRWGASRRSTRASPRTSPACPFSPVRPAG